MARRIQAAPQIPSQLFENLGSILEELKEYGLTLAPIETSKPAVHLSIHDFIPGVTPFSGSLEQDGISVDEWRVRMRMKLAQMDQIINFESRDMNRFKANYVLSMLTGRAWDDVKVRHVNKAGTNPTNGFGDAESVLEYVCDTMREKCAPVLSEKHGYTA